MIKEVIVVEGKNDISAVRRAVDAQLIATHGYGFPEGVKERILLAAQRCGIIVLTDPDYAGERIRARITRLVPNCRHAFVAQCDALCKDNIGIENASPEAIRQALEKARPLQCPKRQAFSLPDLVELGLAAGPGAAKRRSEAGAVLGIGYANAKQFLQRLNHYAISEEELYAALKGGRDA